MKQLGLASGCKAVVEFECGYGTFTISAARIVSGIVYALDIEPEMLKLTGCKGEEVGDKNIDQRQRDFAADGSGLPDVSVDYAMLFNILHVEERMMLIQEAW